MPFKVALVGRPNVGKSSLFNRLIGKRQAITHDEAGSTRDRLYGEAEWLTRKFNVIDTGGIEIGDAPFLDEIREQALIAIDQSDVIIFIVDGQVGLTESDYFIASLLYKTHQKIIVAVNKIDNVQMLSNIYEFYSLGLGDPIGISTHHGIGIGDLLDEVIKDMPEKEEELATDTIRFCIVGRPNVGKSSLTNAILEDNRVIVSDIGGTTRDSIDTDFVKNRQKYTVVDTAGIKKRGRIYEDTDKYSVLRALEALERSDVALLVIDGEEGVILQDKHVAGYITDYFKAVIIVVNKWDKIEKDSKTMKKYEDKIKAEFQFLDYAEVVFLSAKYNDRVDKLFPAINKAYENFCSEFKTSTLNELLQDMIYANPPKIFNQGKASFNYMTQVGIKPPSFVIFTNNPDFVHFSYERYMQNEFRKNFDLTGTPLKIIFRKKE